MRQPVGSWRTPSLRLGIADILCDLSLVGLLTRDFLVATQGSVSSKHTLHARCLSAFPVCIISASWALKL